MDLHRSCSSHLFAPIFFFFTLHSTLCTGERTDVSARAGLFWFAEGKRYWRTIAADHLSMKRSLSHDGLKTAASAAQAGRLTQEQEQEQARDEQRNTRWWVVLWCWDDVARKTPYIWPIHG